MTEEHPMIYMISRILNGLQVEAFAGERSELTITSRLSHWEEGGANPEDWEYLIEAKSLAPRDLVRVIEMTIYELESMRRDAFKLGEKESWNA